MSVKYKGRLLLFWHDDGSNIYFTKKTVIDIPKKTIVVFNGRPTASAIRGYATIERVPEGLNCILDIQAWHEMGEKYPEVYVGVMCDKVIAHDEGTGNNKITIVDKCHLSSIGLYLCEVRGMNKVYRIDVD